MKYAIETFDLTKIYGDFLAVDKLNLTVKNKSIFGFLGPNGAGKTTTIKMLTCLIPPPLEPLKSLDSMWWRVLMM